MAKQRILLIDDHEQRKEQFGTILKFLEYDFEVFTTDDCKALLENHQRVKAIFIGGCEKQGALVNAVTESAPDLPVFLLVDMGAMQQVSSAIQKKVNKVLEWPLTYSVLNHLLANLPEPAETPDRPCLNRADKGLAGTSPIIQQTRALIDQVAGSDATVLILGESGTGKEVVAKALHRYSPRKDKSFVPVNCGAIPGELLESELFGHEKGAFTGALTSRQGRFEMAEGGTMFLDEIGDMPMPMQVKLLRVLQERSFERVGSNKTIHCNVRVVAATHRRLEEEIKEKRFREDLFYRLNVFPIEVPALRERAQDIPYLVNDLVNRMAAEKRGSVRLTKAALMALMQYSWPGNVRELANLIERLAITHPHTEVDTSDLPEKFHGFEVGEGSEQEMWVQAFQEFYYEPEEATESDGATVAAISQLPEQGIDLKEYISDLESGLIKQALIEANGVVAHAAKLLHMHRTTLVEKLRKYDLS